MKKIKTLLLLTFTAIFIIACGKEEEPEPITIEDGVYIGTMTVYSAVGGPVLHVQENVVVRIESGVGDTIDIEMLQVQFASNMPIKLDMTIPDVATHATNTEYAISGNDIIPIAMGGPFPQYIIKDLDGSLTPQNITFSMLCGTFPLSFAGAKIAE